MWLKMSSSFRATVFSHAISPNASRSIAASAWSSRSKWRSIYARKRAPLSSNSLCAHGDIVAFSAAQPGQGGEGHINERNLSTWAAEFARRGYAAYDAVRPLIADNRAVDPWYRYNMIVFANGNGASRLSAAAQSRRIADLTSLDRVGDLAWKVRRALLKPWPPRVVTQLSRLHYRLAMTFNKRPA